MDATPRSASALLRLLALAVALAAWPPTAVAQAGATASSPPPVSRLQARELVASMSDEDVRKLLLEHLDRALPAESAAPAATSPWMLTHGDVAIERLQALAANRDGFASEFRRLARAVAAGGSHPWFRLVAAILLCLGAGALLERIMLRRGAILGRLQALARPTPHRTLRPAQVLVGTAARCTGALVFLAGSVLALELVPGLSDGARILASAVVWVTAGTRLVVAGGHALLLPSGGESPWPVSPPVARTVARHLGIVAAVVLVRWLDRDVLAGLGASADFTSAVTLASSGVLVVVVLVAVFAVRATMGPVPPGDGVGRLLHDQWHVLTAAYVLLVFVVGVYASLVTGESMLMRGLASLSLVLAIPVIDYGLRLLAARLAPAPRAAAAAGGEDVASLYGEKAASRPYAGPHAKNAGAAAPAAAAAQAPREREPGVEQRGLVEAALVLSFRVLLALALVNVVALLWQVRIRDLASALFGDQLVGALSQIGIAGLFAVVVWQIVKAAVAVHAVPEKEGFDLENEGGAGGQTRLQTLMPLVARIVGAALVTMVVLIALSALGVNIGPLLAGAGVVGLAVGFGAQTLVRDIVSGAFFLADDAFRMGEYLQIGNIRGTVEKISVRSLRLRHHRGALHTLPYGEIQSMTNYSRDYAILKFEIRVPFETDVERVRKLIKQVGAELAQNEELSSVMLEPLKSQGVNRMDDSAFVIRCKFTTLPGKQFTVRRVAYALIQEAFAREGIPFAPRRVVVETVAPAGSKEALDAAAAAAAHDDGRA